MVDDGTLTSEKGMDTAAFDRLELTDEGRRYVIHLMFDRIRLPILNFKLCLENE